MCRHCYPSFFFHSTSVLSSHTRIRIHVMYIYNINVIIFKKTRRKKKQKINTIPSHVNINNKWERDIRKSIHRLFSVSPLFALHFYIYNALLNCVPLKIITFYCIFRRLAIIELTILFFFPFSSLFRYFASLSHFQGKKHLDIWFFFFERRRISIHQRHRPAMALNI